MAVPPFASRQSSPSWCFTLESSFHYSCVPSFSFFGGMEQIVDIYPREQLSNFGAPVRNIGNAFSIWSASLSTMTAFSHFLLSSVNSSTFNYVLQYSSSPTTQSSALELQLLRLLFSCTSLDTPNFSRYVHGRFSPIPSSHSPAFGVVSVSATTPKSVSNSTFRTPLSSLIDARLTFSSLSSYSRWEFVRNILANPCSCVTDDCLLDFDRFYLFQVITNIAYGLMPSIFRVLYCELFPKGAEVGFMSSPILRCCVADNEA